MPPKKSAQKHSSQSTASKSHQHSRKICVTAAEGQTGRAIVELLLSDTFAAKYDSVTALVFGDSMTQELEDMGAKVLVYDTKAHLSGMIKDIDTMLLIPPARKDKMKLTKNLLEAAKKAKHVQNLVLLSSAGCDYAERDAQPHLREFIDLEVLAMAAKSDTSSEDTGHSPCIIRAGFYAENLLLYSKQAQGEGKLPIPIDPDHKFAPVSLGDVALFAAHVLTSEGPHGLADSIRGSMTPLTGPMMVAGPELAEAASSALSTKLEFASVSEEEAQKILSSEQGEEIDEAEKAYILEYYSLVREGKTNYVAGQAVFKALCGQDMQELPDFFKAYSGEFKSKKRRTK